MKSRIATAVLAATAALISPVIPGQPAAVADNWGTCTYGTGCAPDSTGHTWCLTSSTDGHAGWKASIRWAMGKMDNQTDMTALEVTGCTSDGVVDVRWRVTDLVPTLLAQSTCIAGGYPCQQSNATADIANHIEWAGNNSRPGSDGNNETGEVDVNLDMSACHELGHTIGMEHHELDWYNTYGSDCMRNPWLEKELSNDGWREYNTHHIDHVNNGV